MNSIYIYEGLVGRKSRGTTECVPRLKRVRKNRVARGRLLAFAMDHMPISLDDRDLAAEAACAESIAGIAGNWPPDSRGVDSSGNRE
jgi:hypothetical protein